jgi:hypothetical protein
MMFSSEVELLEHHADGAALRGDLFLPQLMQAPAPLAVPDELALHPDPARVDPLQMVDATQEC